MLVTTHSLSLPAQLATTLLGAFFAVLATTSLRSRTMAILQLALKSRDRSEWFYVLVLLVVALSLGVIYNRLGLIPLRADVGLTAGSTLVVLGVLWPPYMQKAFFSQRQRLFQRVTVIAIGAILLSLAWGQRG